MLNTARPAFRIFDDHIFSIGGDLPTGHAGTDR
jgi:hypothetical protein